jgi:hypothetical protein
LYNSGNTVTEPLHNGTLLKSEETVFWDAFTTMSIIAVFRALYRVTRFPKRRFEIVLHGTKAQKTSIKAMEFLIHRFQAIKESVLTYRKAAKPFT